MEKQNFDLTLRSVIFQTPIPTVIYIEGKIFDCNKAFLNLFEIDDKSSIIGLNLFELFCKGFNGKFEARYDYNVKGSKFKKFELKAKTLKGNIIYVVIHEADIIFGDKPATFAQIFDITQYKETELKLRTLINATPDIICFKDGQGRWLEANEADLELFSLKDIDYKGKKDSELADFTHPIYRDAFLTCEKTDELAWQKGELSRNEEVIPLPQGGEKIYDVIKVPLFNDDGSKKGLVVLGRDITELKNTQKKLERQLKFSQIINKIAEQIIAEENIIKIFEFVVKTVKESLKIDQCKIFKADLRNGLILPITAEIDYSAVNLSFHKETYPLDKFKKSCEFFLKEKGFIESHYDNINPLLIEESSSEFIHNYYKIKSLLWYPIVKDEEGFYFIVLNNIRQKHKWDDVEYNFINSVARLLEIVFMKIKILEEKEQSLQTAMNLATIISQSINSIVLMDTDGKIQYANPAFEELSGYHIENILGKNIFELITLDNFKDIFNNVKDGDNWSGKLNFLRNDGTKIIAQAVLFPIKDEDDKVINICKISRDITMEIEKEEYIRQLQKMDAIGTLAAGIAHDFNNILTIINGYSNIALNFVDKDSKLFKYLEKIYNAGKKGENLTKQLLAFSKKQVINLELVDINEVIVSIFGMLRRLISEDIKMELRISENLPKVKADKHQIEQILVNLVVNARDALNEKEKYDKNFSKKIIISTGLPKNDRFFDSLGLYGKYIYIFVSDNGIGMDEDVKRRVFEPFFTTKPKDRGTGLGLSTVYGIVKQNKGFIFIDSEKFAGTTVKIYWPVSDEKTNSQKKENDYNENLHGTETILVVEDDQNILSLLVEGLKTYNYKVYKASDGKSALDLLKNKKITPDLIITDIVMPDMDGKTLIEEIKKHNPETKFLYISGYPDKYLPEDMNKNNFIQKPFTIEDILKKIKNILCKD